MSIAQGTETVAVNVEERTWRFEIFTEKGVDPVVRAHREIIKSDVDGNVFSRVPIGIVERSLSKVASQSFKIGNATYTGGEIAGVLSAIADIWRQEDIDARKTV